MCKKALQSGDIKHSSDGGIVYNKVNLDDGTDESRTLTPQEFVEGVR